MTEDRALPLELAIKTQPQPEAFGTNTTFNKDTGKTEMVDMHNLFHQSNLQAKQRAQRLCKSDEAKSHYELKEGNVVAAIGVSGIGKTTMIKLIAQNLKSKSDNNTDPYIFYISLRDIDFTRQYTVLEFLTSSMLSDRRGPQVDKYLLTRVDASANVYILIDALDEARVSSLKQISPKITLHDEHKPDVILRNILSGHILSKSKKLLTSSPGAFHDLNQNYKPAFCVTVQGLSKKSQKELGQHLCNSERSRKHIKNHLSKNPDISSLCFIPMLCRMTFQYLLDEASSNRFSVVSATSIFVYTLDHCKRTAEARDIFFDLSNLVKLASNVLNEGRLIFDVADIEAAGLEKTTAIALMDMIVENTLNTKICVVESDKKFFFSHLLWHKFLAAFHLMFFTSEGEFDKNIKRSMEFHWQSVTQFLFGFANSRLHQKIKSLFQKTKNTNCTEKIGKLRSLLHREMTTFSGSRHHSFPNFSSYSEFTWVPDLYRCLDSDSSERLFTLCSWINELQDVVEKLQDAERAFINSIADLLPVDILFISNILPHQVASLFKVLTQTTDVKYISIGTWRLSATTTGDGLKMLFEELKATQHKVCLHLFSVLLQYG